MNLSMENIVRIWRVYTSYMWMMFLICSFVPLVVSALFLSFAVYLCRLTVVYLAFDVFFAIFCVVLACLIGIALCCCLPCIIAILYTVAGQVCNLPCPNNKPSYCEPFSYCLCLLCSSKQEGASEADLSMLPKYRFQASNDDEKHGVEAGVMVPLETGNGYLPSERVLLPEDAVSTFCTLMLELLAF